MDDPLAEAVAGFIRTHALLDPGEHVLVAVSGGADSLTLFHLLASLAPTLNLRLTLAHLHHGMRGDTADADAEFVREFAGSLGWPAVVGHEDVPGRARRERCSLEVAGRDARYEFFGRAAEEAGCRRVATAHTADDQAETVLMNLLRGTGLDGLAGMPLRRPLGGAPGAELVRPLLETTLDEILDYCARHRLQPREDVTNTWREFLRNRIRHELLPHLEAEYAPHVRERLCHLSLLAREESTLLADLAAAHLERLTVARDDASLHLSLAGLTAEPAALRRRILREAVRRVVGHAVELGWDATQRLDQLAMGKRMQALALPGAPARVRRLGDTLMVEHVPAPIAALPFEYTLSVPGSVAHPHAGWQITAEVLETVADFPAPPSSAWFDADAVVEPLTVRSVRPGDRFRPFGPGGSRKLSDFFIDRKIPRAERTRIPVVADVEEILWIAGVARSDRARITPVTRRAVHLRLTRAD